MAIMRGARPADHFTQIRNDVLRDERLSYRARGVLATILSHTDGWGTSAEALTRGGQEGRDAIRTALNELEGAGYLVRERRQDDRGRWVTTAVVYDQPQTPEQASLALEVNAQVTPTTGFQASVSQSSDIQPSVSQAIRENTRKNTAPTEQGEPAAEDPTNVTVKAYWDTTKGAGNYMGIRAVIGWAIKSKEAQPERVLACALGLYDLGRPLTRNTLGQALDGKVPGLNGARRPGDAFTDHWANGGSFVQQN